MKLLCWLMLSDVRTRRTNTTDGDTSRKPFEFISVGRVNKYRGRGVERTSRRCYVDTTN